MKNPIKAFLLKRKLKKERIKFKIESVLADYDKLLNEYKLIEEKKSSLPFNQRLRVKSRVLFLISKGHIVINSKA
jgi:hypothetical protein